MHTTTGGSRHNLPAELDALIGRERDVDEIVSVLRRSRLLTVTGPGGIGKTRLARHVAARLAGGFADGVWFVPLGHLTDGGLIPACVAHAVGVAEELARDPAETLAAALRDRELMLVLDNCEHLLDECAPFAAALLTNCPRLVVLATSREPLAVPGEIVRVIGPLDLPEETATTPDDVIATAAGGLFVERAAAARAGFALTRDNTAAAVRVVRALDGLPLALELAAARVAALSVEQIADRLDDRFALLTGRNRTAPQRQRTLRATVDWSYELLTPDERLLLGRLSVFAGRWTLEAACAVCADPLLPASCVLDHLDRLVARCMVVVDTETEGVVRYRLLETIRSYATERLADTRSPETFAERHADYLTSRAELYEHTGWRDPTASWQQRLSAFRAVEDDTDDHRAALQRALHHAPARGLRHAAALRWFWFVRGRLAEGRYWLHRLLAAPDAAHAPPACRDAALLAAAELAYEQGDTIAAAELAAEASAEPTRDDDHAAAVRHLQARLDLRRGNVVAAARVFTALLDRARRHDDDWATASALAGLAATTARRADDDDALRLHGAARDRFAAIGHLGMAANHDVAIARLAHARGDLAAAREHYERAHATLTGGLFLTQQARCLSGLAAVARAAAEPDHALRYEVQALRINHATGQRAGIARGLAAFAVIAEDRGDRSRAGRLRAVAERLHRRGGATPDDPGPGSSTAEAVALALELLGPEPACAGSADPEPADPPRPAPITARERQVADLVARGLTNREIAAELVISPGTAGRHVSNILGKLEFTSRAQIAAWAAERRSSGSDPRVS